MKFNPGETINIAWLVFLVFWLVSSLSAKRIARGEGARGIVLRVMSVLAACFLLARGHDERLGVLARSIVRETLSMAWVGAILTSIGVAFAIWARVHIGKYWSATVALKAEHQLIRSGPYARIRHPIYTGILLAIAGTAIAVDTWSGVLALAIYVLGFWLKARKEEALLAGEFGPAFEKHRRATGFFLPKLLRAP